MPTKAVETALSMLFLNGLKQKKLITLVCSVCFLGGYSVAFSYC